MFWFTVCRRNLRNSAYNLRGLSALYIYIWVFSKSYFLYFMKTVDISQVWVVINFYVVHTKLLDLSVNPLGCSNLRYSHVLSLILHNK